MKEKTMPMPKNKCRFCQHEWISRTDKKPTACPSCKRYEWDKEKKR